LAVVGARDSPRDFSGERVIHIGTRYDVATGATSLYLEECCVRERETVALTLARTCVRLPTVRVSLARCAMYPK
jgi:hypothetical protein